ncbi:D-tagatose-bisphosphate aldolase, class II, non-catalytic subunit [Burkholderiaceae bacterium DAT-1]|nr:D-tagatose-bisphosphate aldolase, class II, non-catalytic subunit [Burkholderiaceae bacterium DAT-1]
MNRLHHALTQRDTHQVRGVYSVCSANEYVLRAAMSHAGRLGIDLLIEATSNQVDQYGGYTGMTPAVFRQWVETLAAEESFPLGQLHLGGDHLGPNAWQALPAAEAMARADVLIDAYVRAGFSKIHLDCSMRCADDQAVLSEALIAERAARLCAVAESAAVDIGLSDEMAYVIGTEVPVPGGETSLGGGVAVTRPEAAASTIEAHRQAFIAAGLASAWSRIMALVVQPGVDFDHTSVQQYTPANAVALTRMIDAYPSMVFEAHSTDYQPEAALTALVRDRFAILKVGPGVTHALREGWFALAAIEREVVSAECYSALPDVLDSVMIAQPKYWQKYYQGDAQLQLWLRRFSFSDRSRYYWGDAKVMEALNRMIQNLRQTAIPLCVLSQYMPEQYQAVLLGELDSDPVALARHKVERVLNQYARACGVATT